MGSHARVTQLTAKAQRLVTEGYSRKEVAEMLDIPLQAAYRYTKGMPTKQVSDEVIKWAYEQLQNRPTLDSLSEKIGVKRTTLWKYINEYKAKLERT